MDTKSILYFNISENLSALRLLKYWYALVINLNGLLKI